MYLNIYTYIQIHTYICICNRYIHMYLNRSRADLEQSSGAIYVYICVYMCVYVYTYIYKCIYVFVYMLQCQGYTYYVYIHI